MDENIFMISDASWSSKTKIAGLGVVDLESGIKYSMNRINIKSSIQGEYFALVYSVHIALKSKYKNVVFIYDCQSLNLEKLKEYVKDKFSSAQFLWLKRSFTDEADYISKLAREIEEKIIKISKKQVKKQSTKQSIKQIRKNISTKMKLNNTEKFMTFKKASEENILYACMTIATKKEKKVLSYYLNNQNNLPLELATREQELDLYNFIYNVLPNSTQKRFSVFIENIILGKYDKQILIQPKLRESYIQYIDKILDNLKLKK